MEGSSNPVHLVPLSDLKRWDRNYNIGNVPAIAKSIERFGFNGVLKVWKDNVVMAGNHSLAALEHLKGEGKPDPHGIQTERGEWLVPCLSVRHLKKREAEAFALADNRTPQLAEQNPERLAEILAEIQMSDLGLDGTGYDAGDFEEVLRQITGRTEGGEHANDPLAEWQGMPEFVQGDAKPHRSLIVHFETPEAVSDFAVKIGQDFGRDARYIYHPKQVKEQIKKIRYEGQPEVSALHSEQGEVG